MVRLDLMSATALLALVATPALAEGKGDRAQQAIAEARGKVDAANKAGATGETPGLAARAAAALRMAEEDVSAGHKEQAIIDANHAIELADQAIGVTSQRRDAAVQAHQAAAVGAVVSAQQDIAAAQQSAAEANARAANAEARAQTAEQSAAAAAAQADAMRNQPAPTTTVVTTEHTDRNVSRSPVRATAHVVRRTTTAPARSSSEHSTTTTITQTPQPDAG